MFNTIHKWRTCRAQQQAERRPYGPPPCGDIDHFGWIEFNDWCPICRALRDAVIKQLRKEVDEDRLAQKIAKAIIDELKRS